MAAADIGAVGEKEHQKSMGSLTTAPRTFFQNRYRFWGRMFAVCRDAAERGTAHRIGLFITNVNGDINNKTPTPDARFIQSEHTRRIVTCPHE